VVEHERRNLVAECPHRRVRAEVFDDRFDLDYGACVVDRIETCQKPRGFARMGCQIVTM
jgi:hypothetical protein